MKTRDKKKREKKGRQNRSRLRNKRRLDNALAVLGLLGQFRLLPAAVRNQVSRRFPALPQVHLDGAAQSCPGAERLKEEIEAALATTTHVTAAGRGIPLADV